MKNIPGQEFSSKVKAIIEKYDSNKVKSSYSHGHGHSHAHGHSHSHGHIHAHGHIHEHSHTQKDQTILENKILEQSEVKQPTDNLNVPKSNENTQEEIIQEKVLTIQSDDTIIQKENQEILKPTSENQPEKVVDSVKIPNNPIMSEEPLKKIIDSVPINNQIKTSDVPEVAINVVKHIETNIQPEKTSEDLLISEQPVDLLKHTTEKDHISLDQMSLNQSEEPSSIKFVSII